MAKLPCAHRMRLFFCPSRKSSTVTERRGRTWLFNGTSGWGVLFFNLFLWGKKPPKASRKPRVCRENNAIIIFPSDPDPIKPVPRPFLPFFTTTPPSVNVRPSHRLFHPPRTPRTFNTKLTSCPAMISWCVVDTFTSSPRSHRSLINISHVHYIHPSIRTSSLSSPNARTAR